MEGAAEIATPGHVELTGIAFVALAALVCGLLMTRLKQPAVVGYIVAGALLGPGGLGLVESREGVRLLAELGVLMLLFLIGMELSLRGFREVWKVALAATAGQIAISLGFMLAMRELLGWPLPLTLVLGFALALSSTAVVIKMLEELGELRTKVGRLTVGVLIAQDLAVVPMMLIVASFEGGRSIGLDAVLKVGLSIGFLALLIVFLSRRQRIRLPFQQLLGDHVDLTPLAGLAVCFGAAALSGLLGLSVAYGAFLAGLVIGNSTARAGMLKYTLPIQSILLMVFFLSIGLLIDLAFIWENLAPVVVLVAFVTLLKTVFNVGLLRLFGEPWPRAFQAGVLLAQIGEFSFVLAALGLSIGVVAPADHRLIVTVTVLSLVFAPLWQASARRLHGIALLGITSVREILRLFVSGEIAAIRHALRAVSERGRGAVVGSGRVLPRRGGETAAKPEGEKAAE